MPHLREVHQICLHPRPGLLREYLIISPSAHSYRPFVQAHLVAFRSRYHLVEKECDSGEGETDRAQSRGLSLISLLISEGSQSNISGGTEGERGPAAMARAVTVHQDTMKVMYFA